MMMDFNSMSEMTSGSHGMSMAVMWITYIIVLVDLVLGGIAMGKYIAKK